MYTRVLTLSPAEIGECRKIPQSAAPGLHHFQRDDIPLRRPHRRMAPIKESEPVEHC